MSLRTAITSARSGPDQGLLGNGDDHPRFPRTTILPSCTTDVVGGTHGFSAQPAGRFFSGTVRADSAPPVCAALAIQTASARPAAAAEPRPAMEISCSRRWSSTAGQPT